MWFLYNKTKKGLKENVESYYEKFFQYLTSKTLSSLQTGFLQTGYTEIAYFSSNFVSHREAVKMSPVKPRSTTEPLKLFLWKQVLSNLRKWK